MTRARIITNEGVREVSDSEFFATAFGHQPRTPEQKQSEWDAGVERYVQLILKGAELSEYGNPAVAEAFRLIALREGDAEPTGDPLRRVA